MGMQVSTLASIDQTLKKNQNLEIFSIRYFQTVRVPRDVPLSDETSLSCQNQASDFGAQMKHMHSYMISNSIKKPASLFGDHTD